MLDLSSDIIGTNPKYPKIVDHSGIKADVGSYDNYPSDNNPVRVVPKLSEMWSHSNKNINLIPNVSIQQPLMSVNSGVTPSDVVREAKKAMMAGLKGKEVSEHLRSRFTPSDIDSSKDELVKLASEQGLLGNVYIDMSAFSSFKEAEQFLTQNRNRLAREIVVNSGSINSKTASLLASKFHKNVVSSIDYNQDLFDNYKIHLVASGKISNDYVIDSKESLRMAFMAEKEQVKDVKKKEMKSVPKEVMSDELLKMADNRLKKDKISSDEMIIGKIRPILEFARSQFSKGKEASDVKEMLRSKFVKEDIVSAIGGLSVIASGNVSAENINKMVEEDKITPVMAEEIKRVANKFPIKAKIVEDYKKSSSSAGLSGFFLHALTGKRNTSGNTPLKTASIAALMKGISPEKIQEKLLSKVSSSEAIEIMSDAVSYMNSISAGVKANAPEKVKKSSFQEKPEDVNFGLFASVLPSKDSKEESREFDQFFKGADSEIEISASEVNAPQEVEDMLNYSGMDSAL